MLSKQRLMKLTKAQIAEHLQSEYFNHIQELDLRYQRRLENQRATIDRLLGGTGPAAEIALLHDKIDELEQRLLGKD